jgi:effector-binding domain-containing protein
MKILKIVGIILAVLVAAVVAKALLTPKDYNVHRETVINAPAETVFKNVSRYENFPKWSPWQHLDPAMTTTIEGTDGTVGAKYSWKGNKKAGEGVMTITKLEQNKSLEQDLHFIKPFENSATTYMNLEPAEGGTKVTWGMKGEAGFTSRFFMTIFTLGGGMDKAVGKDYEQGLVNLKKVCESEGTTTTSAYEIKETDWAGKQTLSIRQTVKFQDMPKYFGDNFPKMFEAIGKGGGKPGMPLAVFYKYDTVAKNADVAAAIPYEGKPVTAKGYAALNLPASKAYVIDYWGDYEKMKPAYDAMDAKLREMGRQNPDMVIEEYVTDPMNEKDTTKWNTKIYFFVNQTEAKK